MTPATATATADAFNTATTAEESQQQEQEQEQAAQPMGRHYIRDAVPMKGMNRADGTIGADGRTFYLLQCFPVPEDKTPGAVRDLEMTDDHARYIVYYGHMSRFKGDSGMIVGYVEDCAGKFMDYPGAGDIQERVMTQTRGWTGPRPMVTRDIDKPYGRHQDRVAGIDEAIRINREVNENRARPRIAPRPSLRCIGG